MKKLKEKVREMELKLACKKVRGDGSLKKVAILIAAIVVIAAFMNLMTQGGIAQIWNWLFSKFTSRVDSF